MCDTDITGLPWWRPCTVRVVGDVPATLRALSAFLPKLIESFAAQGHDVINNGTTNVDLLLLCAEIPIGDQPLRDRIPEQFPPPSFSLRQQYGLAGRTGHVIGFVQIPERLSRWPHAEVVTAARTLMSRLGVPKVVILTPGPNPDDVSEATLCTLEGGHPTERHNLPDRIRDRLVTAACATEVAGNYQIEPDAIAASAWAASPVPDALAAAGTRMGQLGLLPPPATFADFVSAQLATLYEAYLATKGFSEGMLFAFDPELDVLMVTATGVDKRCLDRADVVAIDHRAGPRLRVLAPQGVTPRAPSVEAWEVRALVAAVPTVRIGGGREVPIIRAGIHAHVGVTHVDGAAVETVAPNRQRFPYGFGCGTDLMVDVARDTAARSHAINDPDDPRRYVRWHLLYHGEMAVELWKTGIPQTTQTTLTGLIDQYDPAADATIQFTPHHIDQPV